MKLVQTWNKSETIDAPWLSNNIWSLFFWSKEDNLGFLRKLMADNFKKFWKILFRHLDISISPRFYEVKREKKNAVLWLIGISNNALKTDIYFLDLKYM